MGLCRAGHERELGLVRAHLFDVTLKLHGEVK